MVTAWVRLNRAQQAALSHIETALKKASLPPLNWYDILLELKREPGKALRPLEIERRMLLPQYGVSRLIERIEKAGYVRRELCDEDARGHRVQITPEGEAMLQQMWPVYSAAIEETIGVPLSSPETATLNELLAKLLDGKRSDCG